MINDNEEYHSRKLKEIINKVGLESPSSRFTENIMRAVSQAPVSIPESEQKSIFASSKIFTGVTLMIAFAALGYFFYYYGSILLIKDFDPVFSPVLRDLYKNLTEIIDAIQISSVTWVIILGFLALLFLEYFFRKLHFFKNNSLSLL